MRVCVCVCVCVRVHAYTMYMYVYHEPLDRAQLKNLGYTFSCLMILNKEYPLTTGPQSNDEPT